MTDTGRVRRNNSTAQFQTWRLPHFVLGGRLDPARGNPMLTKPSNETGEPSQGRFLTEEKPLDMNEELARKNFGMSLG